MNTVIDKTLNRSGRSANNRRKFVDRHKQKLKQALDERFKSKIHGIDSIDSKKEFRIPADTTEYSFIFDPSSGDTEEVVPLNPGADIGDEIDKYSWYEQMAKANGGKGGDGEGEDDFLFALSEKEFQQLLFDYLSLPDFVKNELQISKESKLQRTGFSKTGVASQLSLIKTYINSYARRAVQEDELLEELKNTTDEKRKKAIQEELDNLMLFEDSDLRFKNFELQPIPSKAAVIFCVMDVSGSMDEELKTRAKKFFYMLYLFLKYKYDRIEIRFIAHTDTAKEVNEYQFFYGQENGSTKILSALELVNDIIKKDYNKPGWNIYFTQASDGDGWGDDVPDSAKYLLETIMPKCQYGAYLEVCSTKYRRMVSSYMKELTEKNTLKKFQIKRASTDSQVFDIFLELFKRG